MGPDRGAGGIQDSGLVAALNARLLAEMPEYGAWAARLAAREGERRLLRALMNLRPPMPLEPEFLRLQDALLAAEREKKGIVRAEELTPVPGEPRLALWQGDITCLAADAIVNAANPTLLGCFIPCHGCIDNAIHSAAGLQLRAACARIMQAQGRMSRRGRPSSRRDSTCRPGMSSTRWARSSPARCGRRTGAPWPAAMPPAWLWRRSAGFPPWLSAASPPGNTASRTARRQRSP